MRLLPVLLALCLAAPVPALAQSVVDPSNPNVVILAPSVVSPTAGETRTYGTTARTILALTPWDFRPMDSSVQYQLNNTAIGQTISRTGGNSFFKAPLHLPAGALVTDVGFVFCDTNSVLNFSASLIIQPRLKPASVTPLFSNPASNSGCVDITIALEDLGASPVQVDNNANTYHLEVNLGAADTSIQLGSARVGFRLQVSPASAQVFNDVPPGHPFFQFIQALAAAGITGGCSAAPPLYCPDDPITRGQMAVFLSRALGLHFPL